MSKTPISILQEMMMKAQTLPEYELLHDGGGTHSNIFTYRVTCNDLAAIGTARSKKVAKHEAAKAMLEAIAAQRAYPQLPASPAQSPVRTPLPPTILEAQLPPPDVPFVNAIGSLQELCSVNSLEEPIYIQISETGPPHAKIFTIQCKVATFKETGVAKTKKQAKQEAAKKMLQKLTDLVPDMSTEQNLAEIEVKETKVDHLIEMAKTQYPSKTKIHMQKKVNLGVKLKDYHTCLKNTLGKEVCKDIIEKLQSIQIGDDIIISEQVVENLLSQIKQILSNAEVGDISFVFISSNSENYYAALEVNSFPPIIEIACGKTQVEAKFNVILKLIGTIKFFLK